jgi:hypothetical protein
MFGKVYWWQYVTWSVLAALCLFAFLTHRPALLTIAFALAFVEAIISRIVQICLEGFGPLAKDGMLAFAGLAAFLGIPALWFLLAHGFQ